MLSGSIANVVIYTSLSGSDPLLRDFKNTAKIHNGNNYVSPPFKFLETDRFNWKTSCIGYFENENENLSIR